MKLKKILSAIAAVSMCAVMFGIPVSAEGEGENSVSISSPTVSVSSPTVSVSSPEDNNSQNNTSSVTVSTNQPTVNVNATVSEPDVNPVSVTPTATSTPTTSPTTGNSPLAFLAIPTTLVAAALVVKNTKK